MQNIPLNDAFFQGAVSIEHGPDYLKPWRLPFATRALFPSPGDGLLGRAENTAGVRLRFATDSTTVHLTFNPLAQVNVAATGRTQFFFDATIDGKIVATSPADAEGTETTLSGLPAGDKTLEIWLPQDTGVALKSLEIDDGCSVRLVPDRRPKWITYGSSITHSVRASSGAMIWPAIVARRHQLNLTCLGFGGQCHLDGMIGRLIRDMPADLITMKLGINTYGASTLNRRTFAPAAITLVQLIREKQPHTPIALISPIAYTKGETTPSPGGMTIGDMRTDLADAAERLIACGDTRLISVNGLDVFDVEELIEHTTDLCHPGPQAMELMADNFDEHALAPLLAMR